MVDTSHLTGQALASARPTPIVGDAMGSRSRSAEAQARGKHLDGLAAIVKWASARPTPTANDGRKSRPPSEMERNSLTGEMLRQQWQTPRAQGHDAGRHHGKADSLHSQMKAVGASELWPSPVAADGERRSVTYTRGNPTLLGAARDAGCHGTGAPNLQTVVQASAWPTPVARDYKGQGRRGQLGTEIAQWHTPNASDGLGGRVSANGTSVTGKRPNGTKANTTLQMDMRAAEEPGTLNPDWVEALQGLPAGWTDVDAADVARELAAFRGWPSGPAEPQHEWEPPRTLPRGKATHRQKRLTALGNLVVPLQFAPIFAAIVETEQQMRGDY